MADHDVVIYSSTNVKNVSCSLDLLVEVKSINEASVYESSLKLSFSAANEYNVVHFILPPYKAMTCTLSIRDCVSADDTSLGSYECKDKNNDVLHTYSIINGSYPHFLDLSIEEATPLAAVPELRMHGGLSAPVAATALCCLLLLLVLLAIASRPDKKASHAHAVVVGDIFDSKEQSHDAAEELLRTSATSPPGGEPSLADHRRCLVQHCLDDSDDKENRENRACTERTGLASRPPLRPQDWCCAADMVSHQDRHKDTPIH